MSTEQNYVGRGRNATPNDPTANSATQAVYIAKLQENHSQAIHGLFISANSFFASDVALKNSTDALTEMLECWLLTEYKQEARECSDADLRHMESKLKAAFDTIRLISTLSTDIDNIRYTATILESAGKEVNRA